MSQLSVALQWLDRVKKLLKLGNLSSMEEEVGQLRNGLLEFANNTDVQKALAPELTIALGQLATALSTDLKVGAKLSKEEEVMSQMVIDFRSQLVELHESLGQVLTESEKATCNLTLELAEDHCNVRQFESAMRLLQQAWHRAKKIESERRSPSSSDSSEPEDPGEDLLPDINLASQALGGVLAQMAPLSTDEQIQCAVFGNMLQQLMAGGEFGTALGLLVEWKNIFEQAWIQRKEKEERELLEKKEKERLEKERLEQEERERLAKLEKERLEKEEKERKEKLEKERLEKEKQEKWEKKKNEIESATVDTKAVRENIENRVKKARGELEETCRQLASYTEGPDFGLEGDTGKFAFEVERYYPGLPGSGALSGKPAAEFIAVQLKAEENLKKLEELAVQGTKKLDEREKAFREKLNQGNKVVENFTKDQDRLIDAQQLDVQKKELALSEYTKECENLKLKDSSSRVIQNLFAEETLKFYQTQTGATAKKIIEFHQKRGELVKAVEESKKIKTGLENDKKVGIENREKDVEKLKRSQAILWTFPDDISYGTPLDDKQLNAVLVPNDGALEYFFNGKPIVSGVTLLLAQEEHTLVAKAKGTNDKIYKKTADKEVKLNVKKAAVTLTCIDAIEIIYGVQLNETLLQAAVTVPTRVEKERDGILKDLTFSVDGKEFKKNSLLDAGAHDVIVTMAEHPNFATAPPRTTKVTVKPAQLEILWDNPGATTFTFGNTMSAGQLNATVKVTTEPPLTGMLPELTKALKYFDEKNVEVTSKSILDAGDERVLTVKTADNKNFTAAPPKTAKFKVEKAVRTIGSSTPEAIGMFVVAADLKQIKSKFTFTQGKGELEFYIGDVKLAVGVELKAGDKQKLKAVAVASDNYQPTLAKEEEVDVLSFEKKREKVDGKLQPLLLKKLHTQQKKALNELDQAIKLLGKEDSPESFKKLNELMEEMEEIEGALARWQGPVPTPRLTGEIELPEEEDDPTGKLTEYQKTTKTTNKTCKKIKKLIKHGGMTLENVGKLVPKGTRDTFSSSSKYRDGFKYNFTTPGGIDIEVYGHGPTIDYTVSNDSDSKKGNLVRVKVGSRYLEPDGTLVGNSTESHLGLY